MSTFGICITPSRVQPEVHSEFQTYLKQMGNPFIDESAVLHALYYNDILQDTVVRTIGNIETLDEELHSEYVEQRLTGRYDNTHVTPSVKITAPNPQQEGSQSSLSFTT